MRLAKLPAAPVAWRPPTYHPVAAATLRGQLGFVPWNWMGESHAADDDELAAITLYPLTAETTSVRKGRRRVRLKCTQPWPTPRVVGGHSLPWYSDEIHGKESIARRRNTRSVSVRVIVSRRLSCRRRGCRQAFFSSADSSCRAALAISDVERAGGGGGADAARGR